MMEGRTTVQDPATAAFDKDIEIQSQDPASTSYEDTDFEDDRKTLENDNIGASPDEPRQQQTADLNDQPGKNGRGGTGLTAILSRISTRTSVVDPGPPPDGGWVAWRQVFLQHLVTANTWGYINSFGIFQSYYVTALNRPPSDIAWIGSMQVFLLFFIGTFTGRLTDAGYFRPVFLLGSFLGVFGIFMASISTTYWQLFLSQGVCCGLGNGFMFCPSLSLLSTYFSKRRSFAIGLGAAGSATGGMVFSAMVQQLIPRIGFAWTMRSLGLIELCCLLLCNIGIKPRVPPRRTGALVDWKSFKEPTYVLFAAAGFSFFWGVYTAFYFIGSFARSVIGISYTESVNIIIALNGVGIIGRIIPNFIADRYLGPLNTMIPAVLISSALCFAWIGVTSRAGLYSWAVVYGMTAAAIQSLFPATLSSLTTDLSMAGTRMGMVFTIVSFATLTGTPIAGQLISRNHGGYQYAQVFSALALFVGGMLLCAARWVKSKQLRAKL